MKPLPQDKMNDYELIRKYFDFELNEEELVAVNKRMESDEAFLERMRIFQTSDEEILALERKNTAQKEAKTVQLEPKQNRFGIGQIRALAAAIVLIVGSAFAFWLFSNTNDSTAVLAESYWQASERLTFSNLRSDDAPSETKTRLVAASNFYQQKDFQAAFDILSDISSSDELFHKAALLKGEIYLEQEKYDTAVEQFQIVIEHPNNEHNDYAYWYQTLGYLQLEQVEKAKHNLDFMLEQRYSIPQLEELRKQLK